MSNIVYLTVTGEQQGSIKSDIQEQDLVLNFFFL